MLLKKAYKNFVVLGDCGAVSLPMVLFGSVYAGSYFMSKFWRACLQFLLTAGDRPLGLASLTLDVYF